MDANSIHDSEALLADLNWVQGLARRLLGDAGAGDDVAQEAWLAALRRDEAPSRAWLAGTVRNLAARWWRDQGRRGRREYESAKSESLPSTSDLVEKSELQQLVAQEVLALPEPFRTTMLLRYQEGLKPNRIAARQDVPADTVRWRLRRGERLLRERFERRVGHEWQRSLALVAAPSLSRHPWWQGGAALGLGASLEVVQIAAVLIALIGGAFWLSRDARAADAIDAPALVERGGGRVEAPFIASERDANANDRVLLFGEAAEELGSAVDTQPLAASDVDCVLLGRVLDGQGRALGGAKVQLTTARWGRTAIADEDGSFRLETGLPQGHATFRITADPFHEKLLLGVGTGRGFDLARFVLGEQDLGSFRLGPAGVVTGRISGPSGRPLRASVRPSSSMGHVPQESADASGVFEIGHIPPGTWDLRVIHPGMEIVHASLRLAGGEVTTLDFELSEGPLVSGIVVDERGEPLAGVRVHSLAALDEWSDVSGEDGRFEVRLSSTEPHEILVRSPRYEHALRRKILARAGQRDLRIVMRPSVRCTLRVVDDADGRPVEFFWLGVERDGTAEHQGELEGRPDPRVHEDGRIVRHARPGHDWVSVVAPDFLEGRFAIVSGVQELRLRRGPALVGRLLSNGRPVPAAALRLRQQERLERHEDHERIAGRFGKRIVPDLQAIDPAPPEHDARLTAGERRIDSRTDAEGRFRITGLASGHWRFLARPLADDVGMAAHVVDVDVGDEDIDLGEIELPPSGTIVGQIVLTDASRLGGHRLSLEGVKSVKSDDRGRFVLERVPPGDCWIDVRPAYDVVAAPQRFYLRMVAGETREVVLEIPDRPTVRTQITLRLNGKPLEGLHTLRLRPLACPDEVLHVREQFDGKGQARLALPTLGATLVELEIDGTRLCAPQAIELTHESVREANGTYALDFTAGAIELLLPEALALPEEAQLVLRIRTREAPGVETTLVRAIENGHVLGSSGIIVDESSDGRILVEPVPTGTLDMIILLVEGETEAALPGGFARALPVSPAGLTPLHLR